MYSKKENRCSTFCCIALALTLLAVSLSGCSVLQKEKPKPQRMHPAFPPIEQEEDSWIPTWLGGKKKPQPARTVEEFMRQKTLDRD